MTSKHKSLPHWLPWLALLPFAVSCGGGGGRDDEDQNVTPEAENEDENESGEEARTQWDELLWDEDDWS